MASNKYGHAAEKDHAKVAAEKLRVSFDYLDLTLPEFFIHGLDAEHYRKIFDCVNSVADATEDQIVQQTHPSLEPKSIFNKGGTYKGFPEHLEEVIARKIAGPMRRVDPLDKAAAKAAEERVAQAKAQAKAIVDRAFEVRIAKGYGRIHGIVWDKVFYVVWLDPAHNLYPNTRYGGIRLHKTFATVRGFNPEEVQMLKEANRTLADEYNQLQEDYQKLEADLNDLLAT